MAVFSRKAFVILRFENYYEGAVEMNKGIPVTTKQEGGCHGFGLKSIRMTAEKYGGSVHIELRDNWFELQVLLPVPVDM